MAKVISKDGKQIAYDKLCKGPKVILVDGALSQLGTFEQSKEVELK